MRKDLVPQFEFAGPGLRNTHFLVCTETCLDLPNPQLRTIVLPPDPEPVENPRVENYTLDDT